MIGMGTEMGQRDDERGIGAIFFVKLWTTIIQIPTTLLTTDTYNITTDTYNITTKILRKYYKYYKSTEPAVPTHHYTSLQLLQVSWESPKVC